jgi:putative DNA methylase
MTMSNPVISPKKLIEVALPLDAINVAAAKEKSIRHGHPSTLHLWWARRPLAAARAVIFAQLVHDPEDLWRCQNPGQEPNQQVKGHWTKARAKLFKIIEDLVLWENTTNEVVLKPAREAIRQSWWETCELNKEHPQAKELFDPAKMPGLHDPFAGGGAIPLEAQRLGLEAFASDLNPVAVLINKAMIEIPPKFASKPPVYPGSKNPLMTWSGAAGLAEDVRHYGEWMREEAYKRIGHLYPTVEITKEMVKERPDLKQYQGENLTVIAWLWARTVKSPNPAFSHVDVPLTSTFILSSKEGKEAYVHPVIEKNGYHFTVKIGKPPTSAIPGTRAGKAQDFVCLMSKTPVEREYVRGEGKAKRIGSRLMAIVAEGTRGRVYLGPSTLQESIAVSINESEQVENARSSFLAGATPTRAMITGGVCSAYGLTTWGDLFTPRQLVALTTFGDLVGEVRNRIEQDAIEAGLPDDRTGLEVGGTGAQAYAEAVSVYLAFTVEKMTDRSCSLCGWDQSRDSIRGTFGRQAFTMTWDYAESNAIAGGAGSLESGIDQVVRVLEKYLPTKPGGSAEQFPAQDQSISNGRFISTDPPYYDNIGYAVLSEFFYFWLRRSLKSIFPSLLATISVPKTEELVASPYRHGNKMKAEKFFLDGMTQAMHNLALQAHPAAPITIYYAFKQSETETKEGTSSTGWETFLSAVLKAGLALTGTWPMRTELTNRMVSSGTNALASSIILVCRPREKEAGTVSRRQFVRMLNDTLPLALDAMTRESEGLHSPVAPVDLSQAIIGPGMAIFSKYDAVLEADGTPMPVRTALQLINRFLAEDDFDPDTQFCLHWFEQHGWETAKFGEADTLARAKGTSVTGVQHSGVIEAVGGNVRLLKWKEYPDDWDSAKNDRLPVWEALHQLIRAYNTDGDSGAAKVLAGVASKAEAARQLAYRLYTLSERAGRAEDARAYNEVVTGWSGIESTAVKVTTPKQRSLFDNEEAP